MLFDKRRIFFKVLKATKKILKSQVDGNPDTAYRDDGLDVVDSDLLDFIWVRVRKSLSDPKSFLNSERSDRIAASKFQGVFNPYFDS